MKRETITYSIITEFNLEKFDSVNTLYFTGYDWDTDPECALDFPNMKEINACLVMIKKAYPTTIFQILKIHSMMESEYIQVT